MRVGSESQLLAPLLEYVVRIGSNTLDLAAAPGWLAMRAAGVGAGDLKALAVAHGISWAVWLALVWLAFRVTRGSRTRHEPEADSTAVSRRTFLARGVGAMGAGVVGVPGAMATATEPWGLRLTRQRVAIADLPHGLDGLRIGFLADTHLGRFVPSSHIARAIEMLGELKPDVFILGGDYVKDDPRFLAPAARMFRPIVDSGRPVLAVLGNHDYYAGAPGCLDALRAVGVTTLVNQRVYITDDRALAMSSPGGPCLCIAGVDDLLEGVPDFGAALDGVAEETARIVVSHNPDLAESRDALSRRIDLMLSGHTHGGQVRLPLIGAPIVPSRYGQKYAQGLVRGPGFPVLVTTGVGMSLAPLRWGVPAEVVELTLVRGD
ncbi:MAG: metallophosphoesterase [Phycisphaerales bacterium]